MSKNNSLLINFNVFQKYKGVDCLPKFDVFVNEAGKVVLNTTAANLGALEQSKRLRKADNLQERKQSAQKLEKQVSGLSLKSKKLPKCLIIGSGAAGLLSVDTLRSYGFGSNITFITKENWNPYDRPKLSKALQLNINDISLRNSEYFTDNQINFEKNQQVETIEFEKKQVICKSGKTFDYDKLIIATGLNSVKQETKPGHDLRGVFTLRSYDDAKNIFSYFETLNAELEKSNKEANEGKKLNVISVGGSFIAMEAMAYFADKANSTSMSRHKPYERLLGSLVSNKLKKLHESKNVKFFIDEKFDIVEFKESKERPGCLGAIKLHDNSVWPVDICLLAVGKCYFRLIIYVVLYDHNDFNK
jgi:NAD(P)H-nitrite reductase large subunit